MEQPEEECAATEMGEVVEGNKQSDWIVAGSPETRVIEVSLLIYVKRLLNLKKGLGPESVANSQKELVHVN
jgi:hypothetical protein